MSDELKEAAERMMDTLKDVHDWWFDNPHNVSIEDYNVKKRAIITTEISAILTKERERIVKIVEDLIPYRLYWCDPEADAADDVKRHFGRQIIEDINAGDGE